MKIEKYNFGVDFFPVLCTGCNEATDEEIFNQATKHKQKQFNFHRSNFHTFSYRTNIWRGVKFGDICWFKASYFQKVVSARCYQLYSPKIR